jgi:hypothetical protein
MSKFIKRAAMAILLLLFLFWGIGLYRQYTSYKDVIHRNAGTVIKVGVDNWLEKMAFNALANPSYYLKNSKGKRGPSQQRNRNRGFYLPANLFIFNLNEDPHTFFTKLKVTDPTAFKAFLKERLGMDHYTERNGITVGKSVSNPRIQLAYRSDRAILSFAMKGGDHSVQLCEILEDGNGFLETSDPRIAVLKSMQADISIHHKKGKAYLNFNNGAIEVGAELDSLQNWEVPNKTSYYSSTEPDGLHIWLAGKWTGPDMGPFHIKYRTIPIDSLLCLSSGYFEMRVQGNTIQNDTIIEYGYDENFEKAEIRTLKERQVPATSLLLEGDADSMVKLLNGQGTLWNGYLHPGLFPMLQLGAYTSGAHNFLLENKQMVRRTVPSSNFFQFRANIGQLIKENDIPSLPPVLEKLDRLQLSASKKGKKIALKGHLTLFEREVNALSVLFLGTEKDGIQD